MKNYEESFVKTAQLYEENLLDKYITYIYRENNRRKEIEIFCGKENFMHLCGVKSYAYFDGINSKRAKEFFNHCINGAIEFKRCEIKSRQEVVQKLNALKNLADLVSPKAKMCGSGNYNYLKFDNAVRTNKQILALTFSQNRKYLFYPSSSINLRDLNKNKSKSLSTSFKLTRIIIKDQDYNELDNIKPESVTPKRHNRVK